LSIQTKLKILIIKNINRLPGKDELYAGYCVAIPIRYSIVGSQKSSIPNTRLIPKLCMQRGNQKPRKNRKQAGAELCQAQVKLGLAKTAIAI
jgi:hypothetical protein